MRRSGTDRSILLYMPEDKQLDLGLDKDWKPGQRKFKPKFRRKPTTYVNKLLQALEDVYADPDASRQEKMQAIQLSIQVLPMRPPVKRKTDKDKALEKLLGTQKKGGPKPTQENS